MDKKILIVFFCCLLIFVEINQIRAQLNLKRDDFLGSGPTARRAWWRYHNEGTGQYPTPESGYLRLILQDADATLGEYCNSGIWDGYNMYTEVKIRVRAKAITEPYPGTRGWGLWYSEPFTYDPVMHNAWFLQQAEIPEGYPEDNYWRAQISRGVSWSNHHYIDLETIADISEWHLYEISREFNPDAVSLSIDGTEVLYDDHNIPYRDFSFHTWIDNQIYHIVEDSTEWAVYRRSFEGTSETIIDFVEILTIDSTGKNFTAGGNVLLRKIPNSMGNGGSQVLWKSYGLNSPAVNGVLLLTGRAENYGIYSDDDDIRIMIDDQDFGWDSDLSLNGQTLQDASKTLLIEQSLDAGDHIISIYSDQTPLLYDATFLGSSNGGIIFDQEYHETAPGGTDYEWKSINFGTQGGEVNIYISGTANEDPTPSGYGRYYSSYGDGEDDDLRIELDEINYGYHTDESFYGNRLFGEPQSILITETLSRGWHTLKIYANNTPTLYRVTIYGGNDDTPLPVTLSAFQVSVESQSNLIRWRTESELNNLGFNLYRAFSENIIPLSKLEFLMINPGIIHIKILM
jgi:hypothetical protein